MEKKNLTPSEKGRKTKLSKKSVEELVNIIFRKDDVERKLRSTLNECTNTIKKVTEAHEEVASKYTSARAALLANKTALSETRTECNRFRVEVEDLLEINTWFKRIMLIEFSVIIVLLILVVI